MVTTGASRDECAFALHLTSPNAMPLETAFANELGCQGKFAGSKQLPQHGQGKRPGLRLGSTWSGDRETHFEVQLSNHSFLAATIETCGENAGALLPA